MVEYMGWNQSCAYLNNIPNIKESFISTIYINLDAVRWGLGHVLDEASEQGVFLGCYTRPGEDPQCLGLGLGLGMEFRERITVSEDGRRKSICLLLMCHFFSSGGILLR